MRGILHMYLMLRKPHEDGQNLFQSGSKHSLNYKIQTIDSWQTDCQGWESCLLKILAEMITKLQSWLALTKCCIYSLACFSNFLKTSVNQSDSHPILQGRPTSQPRKLLDKSLTLAVMLLTEMLLNIKWILSWSCSGGWAISLLSVAPRRVSMLLAFAIEGSFLTALDVISVKTREISNNKCCWSQLKLGLANSVFLMYLPSHVLHYLTIPRYLNGSDWMGSDVSIVMVGIDQFRIHSCRWFK